MRRFTARPLPPPALPHEEWRLTERAHDPDLVGRTETLFALSNGWLGLRGAHEEGRPAHEPGMFIAGLHETWPIEYAEDAYGLAKTGQTIVAAPDASLLKLYVDDDPLYLPGAQLLDYERALDLRAGTLVRTLTWELRDGKQVRVRSWRLVSLQHRHVAAFRYEVTLLNADAPVVLSSALLNRQDATPRDVAAAAADPRTTKRLGHRVFEPAHHAAAGTRVLLGYRLARSGLTLGCGVEHTVATPDPYQLEVSASADRGNLTVTVDATAGTTLVVDKFAAYHTSEQVPAAELVVRAARTLDRVARHGWDVLADAQRARLDELWDRADVTVALADAQPADAAPRPQLSGPEPEPKAWQPAELAQAIRWNVFQVLQATSQTGHGGVPAKGLTGSGYEGHYFWDSEVYVNPFLTYCAPRAARNLLAFRYRMLDKARDRARELGEQGALFPWRTITGEEASAYYQAGTAQYHINADVAHALAKYVRATGDDGLLVEFGAEILLETARLWVSLGFYGRDGAFHLHAVTGPDEYTAVVNDNTFTNLMARRNLRYAADVLAWLERSHPQRFAQLAAATGLEPGEQARWRCAADAMFVPFDAALGIHPQDAHFLDLEPWDFDAVPADRYPLLLHHHPLVIYRSQVCKQADVLLAMLLAGDEFTLECKRRNVDYYDPITTGDSSLSAPVQAIAAAEVGYDDLAQRHFAAAALTDLADVHGNAVDGVHVASAGGVWMTLVYGFAGLRDHDGTLSLTPQLPATWQRLTFTLAVRGLLLRVAVSHDAVDLAVDASVGRASAAAAQQVEVVVAGERMVVPAGTQRSVSLRASAA